MQTAGGKVKRILSVIVTSIALLAGTVLAAAPAQAAGCNYTSCYNRDPVAQGCGADAITVWAWADNEVRWSRACQAGWIRNLSGSHIAGYGWDTTMSSGNAVWSAGKLGMQTLYSVRWSRSQSKITTMVPMGTNQLAQVEIRNTNPWSYTPLLNTQPY